MEDWFWLYELILWMRIRTGSLEDGSSVRSLDDVLLFAFPLVSFLYKYHCFPGQLSNVLEQTSRRGSGAFLKLCYLV